MKIYPYLGQLDFYKVFDFKIVLISSQSSTRAKGWIMYGMDSKLKFGDQLKNSEQSKKLGDL